MNPSNTVSGVVADKHLEQPERARFNPETNQLDVGGELYYYTRVAAIAEKAGLKKPLLQSYISDGAGERDRWIRGIQLNPHSKPGVAGLGDNNKELDAYVADQAVIASVVDTINTENALRHAQQAAAKASMR